MLQNYIPHEIIACDDKDPSWINKAIKDQDNNIAFKKYQGNEVDEKLLQIFRSMQFSKLLQQKIQDKIITPAYQANLMTPTDQPGNILVDS